ncbi:MAG TPA: hypothetical protein VFX15_06120 [Actinomycetes bacterium]|nr:hypothetical protein [Actinomycetes bacterium]
MAGKVTIVEVTPDRLESLKVLLPDGSVRTRAVTLKSLLERTGGKWIAEVDDPMESGAKLTVDLTHLQHLDPDTAYVEVNWTFVNPNKVGKKGPFG